MNKLWLTLLLCVSFIGCWAANLPVAVDLNRFLNEKHQTKFEINYQVKYMNLRFEKGTKGYFADLTVKIEVLKADSVLTQKEFTNVIGVSNLNDAESDTKSYMDKISLVLGGKGYKIRVTFTDPKSADTKVWTQELNELPSNRMLSDIELSKSIIPADTTRFMEKFRRNHQIYMLEPSHLFYPISQDSMYAYFQVYSLKQEKNEEYPFQIEYRLIKEKNTVRVWNTNYKSPATATEVQTGISLKDLPYGLYDLHIVLTSGNKIEKDSTFFVLGEIKENLLSVFPKMEDESTLLKYFVPSSKLASMESLSNDGKKRMIHQLWTSIATENNMNVQQWITVLKERISYTNRYFSHFKPGWQTDMGRIYIRMGAPDNIDKRVTSDDTKFVLKDYQIWKYESSGRIYVFIDIQMNGNFKMIFAKNDDNETSISNWERYLGSDFSEDDLEKDSSYPKR